MPTTTRRKPVKPTQPQRLSAGQMIAKIRQEVQNFANNLNGVLRDTLTLAPKVAEAFAKFKEETDRPTKLDFIRMLATPAQQEHWPATDALAKAPG